MIFIPFQASSHKVEVTGETVLSIMNEIVLSKEDKLSILQKYKIGYPEPGKWYNQQTFLNMLRYISNQFGDGILVSVGMAIPDSAIFPYGITTFEESLEKLNEAYHSNHRGDEIGYYSLYFYHNLGRKLCIECNNPYPIPFNQGILIRLWDKFLPFSKTYSLVVEQGITNGGIVYFLLSW